MRHDTNFVVNVRAKSQASGRSLDDLAADFLGVVIASAPLLSRALTRAVNQILDDSSRLEELLASAATPECDILLETYFREVLCSVDDIGIRVGYVFSAKSPCWYSLSILRSCMSDAFVAHVSLSPWYLSTRAC